MNHREIENGTLSFDKTLTRGSIEETFFPWHLTYNGWKSEGNLPGLPNELYQICGRIIGKEESYLNCQITDGVYEFEQFLGLDGVKRVFFSPPFGNFEVEVIGETDDYIIRKDGDGWTRKYYKNTSMVQEVKPLVCNETDWEQLKQRAKKEIEKHYTDENIERIYGKYREDHDRGEYSIRLSIQGFFWMPRTIFGIEEHLFAFYDYPEVLHDMNQFLIDLYKDKLGKVLDILPADVLYISEDLSGKNGPMLSPEHFDEFVGAYYRQLVPFLKGKGVRHIFVDTDGDFNKIIPNFIDAGIEGFLPMDVNAGMDIVAVREKFPKLKFIGGFNKLEIANGREAIDKEFERLMPVIRQGGYIPGCDHQVAPTTSFEDYKYYLMRLGEVMKEAGKE